MNNTPYISIPEMLTSPTGINWDTIPEREATDPQKQAAYLQLAKSGTSWVTTNTRQILNATVDQDVMLVGGRRCNWQHGRVSFITRFSPITEVSKVEVSPDGITWLDLQGATLITGSSSFAVVDALFPIGGSTRGGAGALYLRPTYTHGFVNTVLAADASASDTSIVVVDATGVRPGLVFSIYDGGTNEDAEVDSSYVSGTTIPLVDPLSSDHAAGTQISAMPDQIRRAALLAVIHYVRVRGRSAITIQPSGGARSIVAVNQLEEFTEAKGLLQPFNRVL